MILNSKINTNVIIFRNIFSFLLMYVCMYVGFKTLFYTVRHLDSTASYLSTDLHLGFFRSWPSLYLPSCFFFGLPRALFYFPIHFNTILGNLHSAILWTWPYHVSRFSSISFIIGRAKNTSIKLFIFH